MNSSICPYPSFSNFAIISSSISRFLKVYSKSEVGLLGSILLMKLVNRIPFLTKKLNKL
jgi:hypothetical protein